MRHFHKPKADAETQTPSIAELTFRYEAIINTQTSVNGQLKLEIESKEKEIARHEKRISEVEDKCRHWDQYVKECKVSMETMDRKIKTFEVTEAQLEKDTQVMRDQRNAARNELESLRKETSGEKSKICELNDLVATRTNDLVEVREELRQCELSKEQLATKVRQQAEAIEELYEQLDSAQQNAASAPHKCVKQDVPAPTVKAEVPPNRGNTDLSGVMDTDSKSNESNMRAISKLVKANLADEESVKEVEPETADMRSETLTSDEVAEVADPDMTPTPEPRPDPPKLRRQVTKPLASIVVNPSPVAVKKAPEKVKEHMYEHAYQKKKLLDKEQ